MIALAVKSVTAVLVVFAEPGFPAVNVAQPLPDIRGATVAASVAELDNALVQPGAVLVWRHGSAFPLEAWPAIQRFLQHGGHLVVLGGAPFTRPVRGEPGHRVVDPRTVIYLKALRLNQAYPLPIGGGTMAFVPPHERVPDREFVAGSTVWSLEPKLAGPPRFPEDEGSPGARAGVVRTLAYAHARGADRRFPAAAASVVLDWFSGPFAGGRWVLRPLDAPVAPNELEVLLDEARNEPLELRLVPALGSFHEGEQPAVDVTWRRPGTHWNAGRRARVTVTGDTFRQTVAVTVGPDPTGRVRVSLPGTYKPGLYRVSLTGSQLPTAATGFWMFDPVLFASGDTLGFDGYTLRRAGHPEPVIGTTLMSRTVHRDFLQEPDAAVWDDEFAELQLLGVNLVRTGVWAGWESLMAAPDSVDEAWLRALEAFYLSARHHGIPVLFTFFAFMPPAYGGDSPYFDPRSLAGQKSYVGAVARRFAGARQMMWDLINEPSFASSRHVWSTRPNGDAREAEAFRAWLRQTYGRSGDPADSTWTEIVRRRWRLAPDAPIGVPRESDFGDATVFGERRPQRARDFSQFAQDAFRDWALAMRATIRDAGSAGAITVGQDEGGLTDRPSPLYHHDAVEFTSMHTWWLNDALWWDGLMAKATGTPLLVSETGIMQRELLSGAALREPAASASLLARKLAYAFAAGAFGAVEWVYDVNPYMDSDNEVAIGIRRADLSYKPELGVLQRFAAFARRSRARFEQPAVPDVVLLATTAELYPPRAQGVVATRRAIEVLSGLGSRVRVVPEYRAGAELGSPRLIILPAIQGLADEAWRAIDEAVRGGATLLASGYFEADDAGLPAVRLGETPRPLSVVESGDSAGTLRYPYDVVKSAYAAAGAFTTRSLGAGRILHYPAPLEWAYPSPVQERAYANALRFSAVPAPAVRAVEPRDGRFVLAIPFRDATLVILVNETSQDDVVRLAAGMNGAVLIERRLAGGDAELLWVAPSGEVLDSTSG
jgi:hypothetical protein